MDCSYNNMIGQVHPQFKAMSLKHCIHVSCVLKKCMCFFQEEKCQYYNLIKLINFASSC